MDMMGRKSDRNGPRQRINVTPLVDVVLVLLIIFLVVTPLSLHYLRSDATADAGSTSLPPVRVTFHADGSITIHDGDSEITTYRVNLARELRPILAERRGSKAVVVDVAAAIRYGDAIGVMDTIKGVGADAISLAVNR